MFKLRFLALTCLGALAACAGDPSTPPPTTDTGALMIAAEVVDTTATTAVYEITGDGLADPLTGTMNVVDGAVEGQLQVPVGSHDLTMKIFAGDQLVCQGRADDMLIATGRTSQVTLIPTCGPSATNFDSKSRRNHAPEIHAVFASARTVVFKEVISISVSASDPDGDDLSYKWTEQVAGLGFADKFAAATSWQAGPQEVTQNKLTITVKDDRGGSAKSKVTIDLKGLATGAGTCAEPTRIKVGDTLRGFTLGNASDHNAVGPECNFEPGADQPEHVFKLRLTTRQDVSISVANSSFSARVYVRRTACADPAAQIACDAFSSQRVDLIAAEPGDYYIFVDGANQFSAPFEFLLSVFSGAAPENCTNFNDDDGDTLQDCADPDCANTAGCRACVFECDPDPNDCIAGRCNPVQGVCDTFIRFGESCDTDGNPATAEICGVQQADVGRCVPNTAVCGNGNIENGEQCDDGNQVPADGCDPDCIVRAVCGNGLQEDIEQCDDGNTTDGDGCRADCTIETICGNGIPEFPEECDDGNTAAGDGCDPTCRVELCGGISCDDGNPCTVNGCNPTTQTCTVTNLPDNSSCELDGVPETAETCQVGVCVAPPPDPALLILDTAVLADPAFSFRAMQDRMASDGNGAALFAQWATTLTVPTTVENGRVARPRPGFTQFFNALPRNAGVVDLTALDFLPAAMVNRFDLRTAGNCGENRMVFTKATGATDGGNRMTLIFEFVVPDDGSNCRNAIARWTALRDLSGAALRDAAADLLETFAVPANLNQFRTNEFINAPVWELREFHLVAGQMVPFPVMDSPPFELGQNPAFRQFVVQNASALNRGAREIGLIPLQFLDAATQVSGQSIGFGNIVPSLPGLEQNVNIMSCSGCHSTNTGTGFVHVIERTADAPAQLSQFMRSELDFRGLGLELFLLSTP